MKEKNKKREISIADASREEKKEAEVETIDEAAREATVIPGKAAAQVYQQQADEVKAEPEAAPETEKKVEKEPFLKFGRKDSKKEEELKQQVAEFQDKLLRSAAEFDNFRKRTDRERIQLAARANARLVSDLLPALDNFQLALQADPSNHESFRAGVEMIQKQFIEALSKHGVELIEAEGQHFDPELHEALMSESSPDHEEGDITQVLQAGYKIQGLVLRPARVKVASAPPEQTEEENAE